ncbi:MAG TPA: sialidase family protein [Terriglobales bacterium]|nr:sialidase family protein [Terriglobales bacterium]
MQIRAFLRWRILFGCALVLSFAALVRELPVVSAQVSAPPSSSISSTSGQVAWDFNPVGGGTVVNVGIQDICPPELCDDHDLTIVLPSPAATLYQTMTAKLTLQYTWTSTVPTDLDIFAISPSGADHGPGSPDVTSIGAGEEDLTVTDPIDGSWHIRSVASLAPIPTGAHLVATLTVAPRPTTPPPPPPAPGAPTFTNYPAPNDCTAGQQPPACIQPSLGSSTASTHAAGEPSIGVDWKTGKTFLQAGNHTLRVTFNDTVSPATAFWEDKRSPFSRVSLDPIGFVDDGHLGGPNRVFTSQLDAACSEMSFSDDDANNWLPSQGCGVPAGADHQTVGGGKYADPAPAHPTYPHAIYYCSQEIATAICARSDDGGLTFGPGIPMYTFTTVNGVDLPAAPGTCGGLHGHVRVAPDGTVYVPNKNCQDVNQVSRPGVAVSVDNGLTWTVRTIPDGKSLAPGSDPSVAAGLNNTIYFGYINGDGHAKIATSNNRGMSWSKSQDAGTPFGVQNGEFAEVMAGDDDRAAFAFLGTQTQGDTQSADFLGLWHLYVAFTYDTGRTWTTVDATPADPVQRGCIWNGGGSNPCRNLLTLTTLQSTNSGASWSDMRMAAPARALLMRLRTPRQDQPARRMLWPLLLDRSEVAACLRLSTAHNSGPTLATTKAGENYAMAIPPRVSAATPTAISTTIGKSTLMPVRDLAPAFLCQGRAQ